MVLHYWIDENKHVEWTIYPKIMAKKVCKPDFQKNTLSLVQSKLAHDAYDKNFSNGLTMFNSQTSREMVFVDQKENHDINGLMVTTTLKDQHQNLYDQKILFDSKMKRLKIWTEFTNTTSQTEKLEYLTSFVLNSLSPFYGRQLADNLQLIRLRSKWAMEGRVEQRLIEDYDLEMSWKPSGLAIETFGQNGTMPVRKFFPIIGLRDTRNDVTWLAELEGKASWRLNAARVDDRLVIFGGLPDNDDGKWFKYIDPGETYQTPYAYITVGQGSLLKVSSRLQRKDKYKTLPIIYNEWGTTWGHPSAELVHESVRLLEKHMIDTYVIDAGWYKSKTKDFNDSIGDWQVDEKQFPRGFTPVVKDIHDHQMKAGIWFEFEGLGKDSQKYYDTNSLVKRDNWPVTTIKRRFLNMTDERVKEYLDKKVIHTLIDSDFDYLKIDYNDSIGIGADGDDSPAEGLQTQISGTIGMLKELKKRMPKLTIESCSSGGHRLTPAFIENTDLSSFSDAHETNSIPIIAANELNVIPANKNLIWCTVHQSDTIQNLQYHLIATFLGRICMSGDIRNLSVKQWQVIDEAFKFYQENATLISNGMPFRYGTKVLSYQSPKGYQISGFMDGSDIESSQNVLMLIYRFGTSRNEKVNLDQFSSNWELQKAIGSEAISVEQTNEGLTVKLPNKEFCAKALILKKH